MVLSPGTRIGPYEVTAQIGVGGMGEVYRATDTKLKRPVALKVLPESVANDRERLARFQREAEVLASLNHTNIAGIYGVEESGGVKALVMEFVEGPTLAERIAQGAMLLDDALPIAKQIAEALEAAHEQGIIHRDLKPANIKVRPDGTVKVLDFGLAKAVEGDRGQGIGVSGTPLSQAPTITSPAMMTGVGMILGTAAYMSPEQAKGKPVDRRADVWAFGCVVFEMLCGTRAFEGNSLTETIAAILMKDPPWSALSPSVPPAVLNLLRRTLDRDPHRRLRDIGEARVLLEDVRSETVVDPRVGAGSQQRLSHAQRLAPWGLIAVLLLALGPIAIRHLSEATVEPRETRLELVTPSGDDAFAVSPDGRTVVYVAANNGPAMLWARSLNATGARVLSGTEGAGYPFWSPDSRSIAFFSGGNLKRVDVDGGAPVIVAPAGAARGGSWGLDNTIVFTPTTNGGLARVSATGGQIADATALADGQISHRFPHFLPDGRRFLFLVRGANGKTATFLGTLDSQETRFLIDSDTTALYLPTGWLIVVQQGALIGRRFTIDTGTLTDERTVKIADRVRVDSNASAVPVSVTQTGLLAYRLSGLTSTQLTWFNRAGQALGTVGAPDEDLLLGPMLSPNGHRVAFYRSFASNSDIWLLDGTRTTRFTFAPARDQFPVWSTDGDWLFFSTDGERGLDMFRRRTSGASAPEPLLTSDLNKIPTSVTPDGRMLLYYIRDARTNADLWVLPLDGTSQPSPFLVGPYEERLGQFSPDGRWVLYESDESGRPEIYVRPFPRADGQWQVSTNGGVTPRWRRDGREIYYVAPDGTLMASTFAADRGLPTLGDSLKLFATRMPFGGSSTVGIQWQYDVAADGRFLLNSTLSSVGSITVVQNWAPTP